MEKKKRKKHYAERGSGIGEKLTANVSLSKGTLVALREYHDKKHPGMKYNRSSWMEAVLKGNLEFMKHLEKGK